MNKLSVVRNQDGTETWTNRSELTGDTLRYVFRPSGALVPGDRIENMPVFQRSANGLQRVTEVGRGALSAQDIAAFPPGSFVRMREAT